MPLSPAHSPSRSCSRTPIHETEEERSHSSSISSTHSQETKPKSQLPQTVKIVMMLNQHPKRATSLKQKMRQTPTAEPQITVKVQTVAALIGKVLVAVAKFQMLMAMKKTLTGKPMNPAVRLKSQTLRASPALQNLMMKL